MGMEEKKAGEREKCVKETYYMKRPFLMTKSCRNFLAKR